MKKIVTHPFALEEMVDLLEKGYHCAYTEDCGEYYTMLITNDNGKMKDEEITDRYFDFEYVEDMKNKINSLVGFVDSIIENVDSDITLDDGLTIGECWERFVEPVLDMIKEKDKEEIKMALYNVVGIDDLEGLTFARCTTMVKAEKAKTMLEENGFECMVRIVKDELDVDTVEIDGKFIEL